MRILVISTWFPYPLSQGSKIRAYYLIKELAKKHSVTLISFADTPIQPEWVDHLKQFCQRVVIVPRHPFEHDRLKKILGWFSWLPSAVVGGYSKEMADQTRQIAAEWAPECVFALTFVAAPYARMVSNVPKVLDVDYLMCRMLYEAYLSESSFLKRARRWLAWRKFQNYEKRLYPEFNNCLVVSDQDREAFRELIPHKAEQVFVVSNGIDSQLNHPGLAEPVPESLVFNGALTYQANFDAMDYFLREIFPFILDKAPDAQLSITGSNQGVPLNALPPNDHVRFTGYLEDIRPAVASSWVCIVPLRVGGGTRFKILEAMALGTPVVSTLKGAEGLDVEPGKHLLIADTPEEFAKQTINILRNPELRNILATNAALLVNEKYEWTKITENLCDLVDSLAGANS
jgi:sugar transferase (PEP-CTERM/EpsH1 system associated)